MMVEMKLLQSSINETQTPSSGKLFLTVQQYVSKTFLIIILYCISLVELGITTVVHIEKKVVLQREAVLCHHDLRKLWPKLLSKVASNDEKTFLPQQLLIV